MMFGQMTAGSWIYIGSQGIVQGTYETFVELGRQHYGGDLRGRWILTAGLGGMGGAQPLAATMAGASMLAIECQESRIDKRLATGYLDRRAHSLDEALAIIEVARARCQAGIGRTVRQRGADPARAAAPGRAARCRDRPDLGARSGQRLPAGRLVGGAVGRAAPQRSAARGGRRARIDGAARAGMLAFKRLGVPVFDYGNNIRQVAYEMGVQRRVRYSRASCPQYIRPLFCRGVGPFRWAALSGDPEDIARTDAKVKQLMPRRPAPAPLARHGRAAHPVPGPAGAHLLGGAGRPAPPRAGVQRHGGLGRALGADRDRPRSSRLRLGREPQPRDRSDARRLGRGVGLAAAQCAAQHRQRRHLGVVSSRRRRRHGLFAARRRGHRLRRHQRRRAPHRAACCGTIRPPASCATPTPAIRRPSPARANTAWCCRCWAPPGSPADGARLPQVPRRSARTGADARDAAPCAPLAGPREAGPRRVAARGTLGAGDRAAARQRQDRLRRQHRLRPARADTDRSGAARAAAAKPGAVACRGHRGVAVGCGGAAGAGAEDRQPRAGLFRRPSGDDPLAAAAARGRGLSVHTRQGFGRGVGRPRAAGASGGGAARRRPGASAAVACCAPTGRWRSLD